MCYDVAKVDRQALYDDDEIDCDGDYDVDDDDYRYDDDHCIFHITLYLEHQVGY